MNQNELGEASVYHRGYEDGRASRDASEWMLDIERRKVVQKLRDLTFGPESDSNVRLAAVAACVIQPEFGWTFGACDRLRGSLVHLLGGDEEQPAETAQRMPHAYELTLQCLTDYLSLLRNRGVISKPVSKRLEAYVESLDLQARMECSEIAARQANSLAEFAESIVRDLMLGKVEASDAVHLITKLVEA